jgi:hypothetical protein
MNVILANKIRRMIAEAYVYSHNNIINRDFTDYILSGFWYKVALKIVAFIIKIYTHFPPPFS